MPGILRTRQLKKSPKLSVHVTLSTEMILKELRISRHLSQEQLALMSGLNVRTIQRIESGHNASLESMKSLASALDTDVDTLNRESFMIDKNSENWKRLPIWLKGWFFFNYLAVRPKRRASKRVEWVAHAAAFLFIAVGVVSEPALVGGLLMLCTAHLFSFLTWQGDRYGIWYDFPAEPSP